MTLVDLHSDLLLDVAARRFGGERNVFGRLHQPALAAAGVRVQVLAVFTETHWLPEGALRHTLNVIEAAYRDADESDGALRIVRNRSELDSALADGAIAGILALEGAEALGRDPELAGVFARLGVRSIGLTWNRANDFADGATEDRGAGITPAGRRLCAELADLGVALDLSHLTARGAVDALEHAPGPVFASHSNAAALYATRRNIDDDQIAGIAARGGVVGVNLLPVFLGPGAPAEAAARHLLHIARVGGAAAPAIGADFVDFLSDDGLAGPPHLQPPDGADPTLADAPEPHRVTTYAAIEAAITAASGPAAAAAALGGNALAFLRRVLGS